MDDSHKIIIGLLALALVIGWYCKQRREQMMGHQMTAMPDGAPVMLQPSVGGLAPADTDPVDYAPYKGAAAPCQMQEPYAG